VSEGNRDGWVRVFPADSDSHQVTVSTGQTAQVYFLNFDLSPARLVLEPEYAVNYLNYEDTCEGFTATVTNADGIALDGIDVTFRTNFGTFSGDEQLTTEKTDRNGQASVELCSTEPGRATVTAWVDLDRDGQWGQGGAVAAGNEVANGVVSEPGDTAVKVWTENGLAVEKVLTSSDPAPVGTKVTFDITITNTGRTKILSLPLEDTYETDYLSFVSAMPAADDDNDDGTLNWTDLLKDDEDGLAPGESVSVSLTFVAKAETDQGTVNRAVALGALDENERDVPDAEGQAKVTIAAAQLTLEKTAAVTWQRTYDWTVSKSASPAAVALEIPVGGSSVSGNVSYTISATRTLASDAYSVTGSVIVTNSGNVTAYLLSLVDELQEKVGNGDWTPVASQTLFSGSLELAVGATEGYSYSFNFTPKAGAQYRNVATATYASVPPEEGGEEESWARSRCGPW
jgi:hypothetical protein